MVRHKVYIHRATYKASQYITVNSPTAFCIPGVLLQSMKQFNLAVNYVSYSFEVLYASRKKKKKRIEIALYFLENLVIFRLRCVAPG